MYTSTTWGRCSGTCNLQTLFRSLVHSDTHSLNSESVTFLRFWIYMHIHIYICVCMYAALWIPQQFPSNPLGVHMSEEALRFTKIWYNHASAMAVLNCRIQFRPETLLYASMFIIVAAKVARTAHPSLIKTNHSFAAELYTFASRIALSLQM